MPFPKTITELATAGYVHQSRTICRGCHAKIEFWKTPSGKTIPMDVDDDGNCVSHFATCTKAKDFRK